MSATPVIHWFDAVPYGADGIELACYLDGPADHFRPGCGGCGWRGTTEIRPTGGPLVLPDGDWEALAPTWEREHYIPAVIAEHEADSPQSILVFH